MRPKAWACGATRTRGRDVALGIAGSRCANRRINSVDTGNSVTDEKSKMPAFGIGLDRVLADGIVALCQHFIGKRSLNSQEQDLIRAIKLETNGHVMVNDNDSLLQS